MMEILISVLISTAITFLVYGHWTYKTCKSFDKYLDEVRKITNDFYERIIKKMNFKGELTE